MRAHYLFFYLNLLFNSRGNFSQIKFHFYTQIRTTTNTLSTTTLASAKTTKSTKMSAKNITEMGENILHVHVLSTKSATRCSTNAGMTVLVVTLAFLVIAQHFISLSGFFKFFLRSFVAGILIRVKLNSFLAVCFLNFFSRSRF